MTFRYRDTETGAEQRCTLGAEDFIHRFLQHVLPKGFVKVRYYGLFSPGFRKLLATLHRQLNNATAAFPATLGPTDNKFQFKLPQTNLPSAKHVPLCPLCGRPMQPGETIPLSGTSPR